MTISKINNISRTNKRVLLVFFDCILMTIAYWGAYWVRLDSDLPIYESKNWLHLFSIAIISLFLFVRIGLYRAVLRYVTFRVFGTILFGVTISTVFMVISAFYFKVFLPRTTSIIFFAFMLILIGGLRLSIRGILNVTHLSRIPVLIYGAGASGRQLQTALYQGQEFYPVAFIDDNLTLVGSVVQNLRVYHASDLKHIVTKQFVKKILLAMPSCSSSKRSEIIATLENVSCEVLSVPNMADLITGRARIDQLNSVSIDDLLGRESAKPIYHLLSQDIFRKNVLVTGAGGSIGAELCRQIVKQKPNKLVLFELSEYGLYKIHSELESLISELNIIVELIPLLGSVQRYHRLESVFNYQKIQTIYHAAAYKHVPIVEYNVIEGIRNNIFGTLYASQAAINTGVERFVLISTDKAVRPTNTMGATKRFAELILQALSATNSATNFGMVRFGNVLGSSGSVIPLFKSQIARGGPLTVTHEDITRYFMTIPEAAQLVIQAGAMSSGGDVFLLDMGQPVKIYDLAKRMIRLSGKSLKDSDHLDGEIEIKVTGLRPGEKLYEELLIDASAETTLHPRIKKAHEVFLEWDQLSKLLSELDAACTDYDYQKIRQILLEAPLEFQPTDEICDLLWMSIQKHNS